MRQKIIRQKAQQKSGKIGIGRQNLAGRHKTAYPGLDVINHKKTSKARHRLYFTPRRPRRDFKAFYRREA
jgi:hypothetical protein